MPEQKEIAYILKGYPRLSETFISSEIYRLERAGMCLKLFVVKPKDEKTQHKIVSKIKAIPFYLAEATSSKTPVFTWLRENYSWFSLPFKSLFRQRPLAVLKAASIALKLSFTARESFQSFPKKKFLKEFFQAAAIAEEILKSPQIGHIHAHFCHGATTITWLISVITGKTFSFTAHAKDIYSEDLNPNGMLRLKMDKAEFIATCTDANKRYLDSLGSRTEVHCIYHGINADFSELLEKGDNPSPMNGVLRALAVGRLVEKKGFDTFVDACNIMHKSGIKLDAKIIGESGESEKEIKRRIKEYGLSDKVNIYNPMTQSELFKEYMNADVFCLPCRVTENGDRDGIPNVLAEAMACGLTVVSTDVSGIPEIVKDGVNGLLVKPDNAAQLAKSMMRIRREPHLKEKLGKEAKATIDEKFNAEKHIKKLVDLFQEVLRRQK